MILFATEKRPLQMVHPKTRLIRNVIGTVLPIQIGIMAKTPMLRLAAQYAHQAASHVL
jgi:hypothetical protein